jgi:hypothetical protein
MTAIESDGGKFAAGSDVDAASRKAGKGNPLQPNAGATRQGKASQRQQVVPERGKMSPGRCRGSRRANSPNRAGGIPSLNRLFLLRRTRMGTEGWPTTSDNHLDYHFSPSLDGLRCSHSLFCTHDCRMGCLTSRLLVTRSTRPPIARSPVGRRSRWSQTRLFGPRGTGQLVLRLRM